MRKLLRENFTLGEGTFAAAYHAHNTTVSSSGFALELRIATRPIIVFCGYVYFQGNGLTCENHRLRVTTVTRASSNNSIILINVDLNAMVLIVSVLCLMLYVLGSTRMRPKKS